MQSMLKGLLMREVQKVDKLNQVVWWQGFVDEVASLLSETLSMVLHATGLRGAILKFFNLKLATSRRLL